MSDYDVEAMRECANQHNIKIWAENGAEYECLSEECANTFTCPWSADMSCPECGADARQGNKQIGLRYWWQTCSPGCLPDSEVMGPFATEIEALEDATDGLMED